MYNRNIYVNPKFLLIVDNIIVLQLSLDPPPESNWSRKFIQGWLSLIIDISWKQGLNESQCSDVKMFMLLLDYDKSRSSSMLCRHRCFDTERDWWKMGDKLKIL